MRYVTVRVGGATYEIPEMWLVGATRTMTYQQAILHWGEQAMAEKFVGPGRSDAHASGQR
jgi:hypothetical protein